MSCYILFYKKSQDIRNNDSFLICRSFHGLKIDGKEIFTHYKISREGSYKSPEILKKEIDEQIESLAKIEENGILKYPNVRLKKHTENSAYYICDDIKCSGYNLLGGQKNDGELPIDCLLRELDEEIFLNFDKNTKYSILCDIKYNIDDSNKKNIGSMTIYIVDFNKLNELTKKSIHNVISNPAKFLSKKINLHSVYDVEIGEIQSLEWVNIKILKEKLPAKFKFIDEYFSKKKDYPYKYRKYKQKYLFLKKNILINNPKI